MATAKQKASQNRIARIGKAASKLYHEAGYGNGKTSATFWKQCIKRATDRVK